MGAALPSCHSTLSLALSQDGQQSHHALFSWEPSNCLGWLRSFLHHSHHSGDPDDHIGAGLVGRGGTPETIFFGGSSTLTWTLWWPWHSVPLESREAFSWRQPGFLEKLSPLEAKIHLLVIALCEPGVPFMSAYKSVAFPKLGCSIQEWHLMAYGGSPTPTSAAHWCAQSITSSPLSTVRGSCEGPGEQMVSFVF